MPGLIRIRDLIRTAVGRAAGDRSGNVAIISALILPVLMGSFGLGAEVASWYANQRAMQNAADSAAIAAASNNAANYAAEAKAVAAHYGFVDGQAGVSVAASDGVTCPNGDTGCYSVTIAKAYPLILAEFVGYSGDATLGGAPAKRIHATAVATQAIVPRPYCLVALGQSGMSIRSNGAPFADLSGCNLMANGDATCHGHDLGADIGDAHGLNSGCGVNRESGVPLLADPYSSLAANIPPDPCGGAYPQEPTKKKGAALPPANQFSGNYSWGAVQTVCGDMELTGPVNITNASGPTTLVIYNGDLDLSGYTLATAAGAGLTVIFAGDDSHTHIPIGGGTLDLAAPTSGVWSGVALYQDPSLTSGVDISSAGNSPTWDITGLVYLPNADVTFSGAVNKASNGQSCFVMVVNTLTINGTGSILAHGACAQAGLTMPSNPVPGRARLVL